MYCTILKYKEKEGGSSDTYSLVSVFNVRIIAREVEEENILIRFSISSTKQNVLMFSCYCVSK